MSVRTDPLPAPDLSNITPLCMPWQEVNHQLRPVLSQPAALLSLSLAAAAYDMQSGPWQEKGWFDFSYLIDNTLLTGPAVNGETPKGEYAKAQFDRYQRSAAALVKKQSPLSLVRGTLRQRENSDTCKCIVMIHRAGSGRYLVAIGFMGTGKRIYDWFSNFRTEREEGMHRGFLQLAQEFAANCPLIEFPATARELGVPRWTLSDIFAECRRPDSRFRVWMAGHSQGGAIMQLAAFREIRRGMLRQHLIGYGFASPSVAYENPGCDLSGFPLYHIINGDDVTPRVGAQMHIGRCLACQMDEKMRARCYGSAWQEKAFRDALSLLRTIHGSKDGLLFTMAFLQAVEALSDQEAAAVMGRMLGSLLPEKLLTTLGTRTDQFFRFMLRRTQIAYARATAGEPVPASRLTRFQSRIDQLIRAYGAQAFLRALLAALSAPHRLRGVDRNTGGEAAYQAIVQDGFEKLSAYPNAGEIPRNASRPLRAGKTPPRCRYRRYSSGRGAASRH